MNRLLPPHRKDLEASGLLPDTIKKSGCFSADEKRVSRILGFNPKCGGLVLPYPTPNGKPFYRVKPDVPYLAPDGKSLLSISHPETPRTISISHQPLIWKFYRMPRFPWW